MRTLVILLIMFTNLTRSFHLSSSIHSTILKHTSSVRLSSSLSKIHELALSDPPDDPQNDEWNLNIAHLLTHHLNLPSNQFTKVLNKSYPPSPSLNATSFFEDLEKLRNNEPIQYILGTWDFHILENILCESPVLIPRPETEELVELLLKDVHEGKDCKVLDIGTGTGCIGLSVLCR